ncbi:MAG UNVERIFIED_CONTAM: DMT family transporter [Rickettsiaceae bacterium]
MHNLTRNSKGFIFCILSGILYGPIGYFGMSVMNANISASNMLLWRYLISAIFVLVILLIQKNSFKWNRRASLETFISGLIFYGSCSYFYFISSIYIGSGLAMVIFFVYPVFVMIYNIIFNNSKPAIIYYISIITILFGLCLLVDFSDAKSNIIGIGLALISAAGYAGYILASKHRIHALPPLESTIIVSIGAAIASLGIAYFDSSLVIPVSFEVWQNLVGIGITLQHFQYYYYSKDCNISNQKKLLFYLF